MQNNTKTWESQFGLYASDTELTRLAEIAKVAVSEFSAVQNKTYEFNGIFSRGSTSPDPNTYSIINDSQNDKGDMAFGLFQNAKVNETTIAENAVCAGYNMYKNALIMSPTATIWLWL